MTNEEIQEIVAKAEDNYDRLKDKVHEQYDEIERLKDLCNKYEEEHKTTFEEWKKAINIIKEVREYINSIGWNTTIGNIQDNVWKILDKVGSDKD